MLGPCQNVAHSLVLSGRSKSQRRPLCLGWDLFRRCRDGGCVVVLECAFGCVLHLRVFLSEACAAEHPDVSFRRVDQ